MNEVYETRQEELETWMKRDKKKVSELEQQIANGNQTQKLQKELNAAKSQFAKFKKNLEQLAENRKSSRWF